MTPRPVAPIRHRIESRVLVPASRTASLEALVLGAIAHGRSRLDLGPVEPGTSVIAMLHAVRALAQTTTWDARWRVSLAGSAGEPGLVAASIDAGDAEDVMRYAAALAALGPGLAAIDGSEGLRARGADPLFGALAALGATIDGAQLPLTVAGPLRGGHVEIPVREAARSVPPLLLIGARTRDGIDVRIGGAATVPAVERTIEALHARDVSVDVRGTELRVRPQRVRARDEDVIGDIDLALYPLAAAAMLGGSVTVANARAQRRGSVEDGARALDIVERIGCAVHRGAGGVSVRRAGALRGVVADLRACRSAFAALACVAACADGPSELVGLAGSCGEASATRAVVAALRACGADVTQFVDGVRIEPAPLRGAVVDAAGDHRVAMAFSVLGLAVPGIAVEGADAVTREFPGFFDMLADLAR